MENEHNDDNQLPEENINQHKWCFCYYASHEHAGFAEKAALLKTAKWQAGQPITISFLNGDREIYPKIIASAKKWTSKGRANLNFQFRLDINGTDIRDTDIRISFDRPGSWSVLGNTCLKIIDKTQPTMNFGWLTKKSSDSDIDRVVLHEFGHAIGLIHEHLNPLGGIKWNRPQVIADLSEHPNYWSESVIETNMFRTFEKKELELTNRDDKSIMMYPIPAKWTLDGFSSALNTQLSQTDIDFISRAYPGNNSSNKDI